MKYYAVKKGRRIGIFLDWNTCKDQVIGFSGAIYKSFSSIEEAQDFLFENTNSEFSFKNKSNLYSISEKEYYEAKLNDLLGFIHFVRCSSIYEFEKVDFEDYDMIAYVDGSYGIAEGCYSSGIVIIENTSQDVKLFQGLVTEKEYAKARNVSGEILASIYALNYANKMSYKKIKICHDYEGISKWYKREWKSNPTNISGLYLYFKDNYIIDINVHFEWVQGHTGVFYNEIADRLAKMENI